MYLYEDSTMLQNVLSSDDMHREEVKSYHYPVATSTSRSSVRTGQVARVRSDVTAFKEMWAMMGPPTLRWDALLKVRRLHSKKSGLQTINTKRKNPNRGLVRIF